MSNSDKTYYFPWVRKGLGSYINEKDSLGKSSEDMAKCRPDITVKTNYESERERSKGDVMTSKQILEKTVKFIGPGDVLKINPSAIMKVHPSDGEEGFPIQNIPFIEFWEPDFPWRYTPATDKDDKLRPWLSLVVLKSKEVKLYNLSEGYRAFKFTGDQESWKRSFLKVSEQYHCAHAQGDKEDTPDFSRLLAIRNVQDLEPGAEYVALLIPTYETGRLRGLGFEEDTIENIIAQQSSWEDDFEVQKAKRQGLEFPVYYSWTFKTGSDSFDTLVAKITPVKVNKPGIMLDVTNMGEGFDYDTVKHSSSRNSIVMPAATLTPGFTPERPFPAKQGCSESVLYDNLEDLLSKNPVFLENKSDIAGGDQRILEGDDDPWIVPPVYGARHAMSTELHDKDHPWIDQVNMDVHNRAAAGLGRQVVQTHQEELVNRAWKQIDAVQALNMELYKRLLSINTNKALKRKTVDKFEQEGNEKYIEYLMRYLSSMKNASAGDTSLSDILKNSGIPESFATATFQRNTEQLSRIVESLDNSTVMENLLKAQTFRMDDLEPVGAVSSDAISKWVNDGKAGIGYKNYKRYWQDIYSIKYSKKENNDPRGTSYDVTLTPNKIKFVDDDNIVASGLTFHLSPYKQVIAIFKKYLSDNKMVFGTLDAFYKSLVNYKYPSYRPAFYVDQKEMEAIEKTAEFTTEGMVYKNTKGQRVVMAPNALCIPEAMFTDQFNVNKGDIMVKYPSSDDYMFVKGVPTDGSLYKRVTFQFPGYKWMTHSGNTAITPSFPVDEANKSIVNPYAGSNNLQPLYKLLKTAFTITFESENDLTVDKALRVLLTTYKTEAAAAELILVMSIKEPNAELMMPVIGDLSKLSTVSKGLKIALIASCFSYFNFSGKTYSMWTDAIGKQGLVNVLSYNDVTGPWMHVMLLHAICNTSRWQKEFAPMMFFINSRIGETPSNVIIQDMIVPCRNFARNSVLNVNYDYDKFKYYQLTADAELQLKLRLNTIKYSKSVEPVSEKKTESYQVGIQDDESFERMKDVASMYYEQFYSDSAEGKKLRDQYLDELMMSKYPILAYPFFPEPTYYYLKMISDKFIIPGLAEIPENGIAMFMSNPAFEEAYLCGMNTEMGKELLWREYPTDQRGSYFRKFWDSESSVEAIRDDQFYDVEPVHLWKGKLGENHKESKCGLLIFAISGQLMRLYPTTKVYLNGAVKGKKANTIDFSSTDKIEPVMETFIREDILLVGFKISLLKALGNPDNNDYGYMLTFEQSLDDLEFRQEKSLNPSYSSAATAYELKDNVTVYGKHVSLFV